MHRISQILRVGRARFGASQRVGGTRPPLLEPLAQRLATRGGLDGSEASFGEANTKSSLAPCGRSKRAQGLILRNVFVRRREQKTCLGQNPTNHPPTSGLTHHCTPTLLLSWSVCKQSKLATNVKFSP